MKLIPASAAIACQLARPCASLQADGRLQRGGNFRQFVSAAIRFDQTESGVRYLPLLFCSSVPHTNVIPRRPPAPFFGKLFGSTSWKEKRGGWGHLGFRRWDMEGHEERGRVPRTDQKCKRLLTNRRPGPQLSFYPSASSLKALHNCAPPSPLSLSHNLLSLTPATAGKSVRQQRECQDVRMYHLHVQGSSPERKIKPIGTFKFYAPPAHAHAHARPLKVSQCPIFYASLEPCKRLKKGYFNRR